MLSLFLFFYVSSSTAMAQPTVDKIIKALKEYNQLALFRLPSISQKQAQKLIDRKTIKLLDRPSGPKAPKRATGILLVKANMQTTWIATRDPHYTQEKSTLEKRLKIHSPGRELWYGYMKLPWPATDRHWLVDTIDNHTMAQKTQNRAWEHSWILTKKGKQKVIRFFQANKLPKVPNFQKAIYLPQNHGAWFFISAGQQTILGYHCTTVIGGNIPNALVTKFVFSSLDDMLGEMRNRAEKIIPTHYVTPHEPIIGGDGKNIPHF